jgi:hypothetical protein
MDRFNNAMLHYNSSTEMKGEETMSIKQLKNANNIPSEKLDDWGAYPKQLENRYAI